MQEEGHISKNCPQKPKTTPKGGGKGKSFVVETTEAEDRLCMEVTEGEIFGNTPGKMKRTAAIALRQPGWLVPDTGAGLMGAGGVRISHTGYLGGF